MSKLAAQRINMGLAPGELPKSITVNVEFNPTYAQETVDLFSEATDDEFTTLQAIWVENQTNSNSLTIFLPGSGQTLRIPAFTQGMYPVIAQGVQKLVISTTPPAATLNIRAILLNVPQPYFSYPVV